MSDSRHARAQYKLLGENFIDIAFKAARAADPAAKLYINEYNLDGPGAKIDALLALIGRLQSRGVPIDGVGSQAHLILSQVGGVQAQLVRLAATGLGASLSPRRAPRAGDSRGG